MPALSLPNWSLKVFKSRWMTQPIFCIYRFHENPAFLFSFIKKYSEKSVNIWKRTDSAPGSERKKWVSELDWHNIRFFFVRNYVFVIRRYLLEKEKISTYFKAFFLKNHKIAWAYPRINTSIYRIHKFHENGNLQFKLCLPIS